MLTDAPTVFVLKRNADSTILCLSRTIIVAQTRMMQAISDESICSRVRNGSRAAFPTALVKQPLYPQIAADLLHHLISAALGQYATLRDPEGNLLMQGRNTVLRDHEAKLRLPSE